MKTNTSIIAWAAKHASSLLAPLGDRWLHTKGVVERAQQVGRAFDVEQYSLLIAAAYVHDIGYAPELQVTGFHPLDGAYYLLLHNQEQLASLVAYHSEAQFEARLRGLATELNTFPYEHSAISDALTYCDMTTGTTGLHISFEDRLGDIFRRYDENHIVNRAIHQAIPSLARAVKQTQNTLLQYDEKLYGVPRRELAVTQQVLSRWPVVRVKQIIGNYLIGMRLYGTSLNVLKQYWRFGCMREIAVRRNHIISRE